MSDTDRDLLLSIQARDADAFEALYERRRQAIFRHIVKIVRNETSAEDLVQETFTRVWTRANQWDGSGSVKAWIYTIAGNLTLNHLRSQRRRPQQPLELLIGDESGDEDESSVPEWMIDPSAPEPSVLFERAEQRRLVAVLVDELSEEKRTVLRMVYDAEMDLRSVADTLGIPEGTVKSRLYHGRKELARRWGQISADE